MYLFDKNPRIIINEDIDKGTQLPFIEEAEKLGYAVVVCNTNQNRLTINGKQKLLPVYQEW